MKLKSRKNIKEKPVGRKHHFRQSSFSPKGFLIITFFSCLLFQDLFGQAPIITAFTPANGPIGTTVTITGTNFNTTPDNNIVIFGSTRAIVTSATVTQLTVTVPTGATYAPITVLNATTGLLAYSGNNFTPTFSPNKSDITTADFDPKVDYAAASGPRSVAIGDLDGDGKTDLAITGNNGVSVFRNTSTGVRNISYAPKIEFPTGFTTMSVAVGDLDGDGKADLAVVNEASDWVSVLRNTSTGAGNISFAAKVDYTTGDSPRSVAIGDLDGDGKADMAVVATGMLSVFRNTSTGAGNISYAAKVDFTAGLYSKNVSIGDLDGDNKADLAVTDSNTNVVSIYRNTSTGAGNIGYAANVDFTTGSGSSPLFVTIGDLDGDGKRDLVVSNFNSTVSVFRNTSTGAGNIGYAAKVDFNTGSSGGYSVAIGDLNGDGKADLAVPIYNSNSVSIFRNTSTGEGNIGYAAKVDFATGTFPLSVSIGDLDGDGKTDLAVVNSTSSTVSIIRNNSSPPTITNFTPTSGPVGTIVTITGTNFDPTPANNIVFFGATRSTVAAATLTELTVTVPTGATYAPITVLNATTVLLAYSTSNFMPTFSPNKGSITAADFEPKVDFTTATNPFCVVIGDLDGDGKAELVVSNTGSPTVSVFRNTSTGVGNISYAAKADYATGWLTYSVSMGDLDGDGKTDLAVANTGGSSVSVLRNISTGTGNIDFASKVDFTSGSTPNSISIGDLDGDGRADLAVANTNSNTVSVFRNTSTGSGNIGYAAKIDYSTGTNPNSVFIGDLDGDGKPDLVVANASSNTVSVFRNTSTGAGNINYASKVDYPAGTSPRSASIGDLDGDGKADLAVAIAGSNTVSVFRNISTGAGNIGFATKVDFTPSLGPLSVSIGDLDGDGKADLVVGNYSSSSASVFRNTSAGAGDIGFVAKVDYSTGSNPGSISLGDLDGDGKLDLALANFIGGTVSVIRNNPVFSALPPTITSFTPTSGPVATTVTITGTNLTGATAVTFGGTAATSFTVLSSTSITAIIGAGTSGKISVTTPAGSATSSTDFTLTTPDLIVISQQPTSTAVCDGSTALFAITATGTTNITYQWQKLNGIAFTDIVNGGGYSGATSAALSINTTGNIGAGDYRCKMSGDNTQDKFSNAVTLSINAIPTAPTATDASSCAAAALTLTASGGTNGQYRWYTAATGATSISGQVNSTYITPIINATTTYYVSINNGTCESTRTEIKATLLTTPDAPTIISGSSCGPGTVTLQAAGATNGQYRWYTVATGGTALAGETNAGFITPALTTTNTYYVSINNGSCESTRTAVLASIFTPPAKPAITASEPVSAGVVQLCLNAITLTAPAGFIYTWSSGQTSQSISVAQPGNYSVVIKDSNGCSSVSSDVLQVAKNNACVNSPPVINSASLITTIGGFVSIDLTTYISDPDNNLDAASLQVVDNKTQSGGKTTLTGFILELDYSNLNFAGSDLVTIRACDQLGVCVEKELVIEVIGDINVFNGISPNGDGINDTWIIEYIDLFPDTQKNRVTLYNRWGDSVWEISDYNNTSAVFTGLNKNGNELTTGTYFYKIEFTGGRDSITGYLSVKR